MTPGLANKICIPFATKVCCNFPETVSHLPEEKAVLTGTPIRQELLTGSREKGLEFTGFSPDKPVILVEWHFAVFVNLYLIHVDKG